MLDSLIYAHNCYANLGDTPEFQDSLIRCFWTGSFAIILCSDYAGLAPVLYSSLGLITAPPLLQSPYAGDKDGQFVRLLIDLVVYVVTHTVVYMLHVVAVGFELAIGRLLGLAVSARDIAWLRFLASKKVN